MNFLAGPDRKDLAPKVEEKREARYDRYTGLDDISRLIFRIPHVVGCSLNEDGKS